MKEKGVTIKGKRVAAIISGQIVGALVLERKRFLWWERVLVSYKTNLYDGATFIRSESSVKWINSSKILQTP